MSRALLALRDAEPAPFWLEGPGAPPAREGLTGPDTCDLAIVGGGFTGLWAALLAKQRDPGADVVVLEAGRVARQASGRNGGICMSSLTHGVGQGAELFPREERVLMELGLRNLDAIEHAVAEHGIACGWERTGELDMAIAPWHVEGLEAERDHYSRLGVAHEWLDREALQADVHSPTYLAGLWHHDAAILDPARLAWGLARVCAALGVRFYERTPVTALSRRGGGVGLATPWGGVRARRAVLATNAFRPLLRRLRLSVVPVYDYVLMTEPLTAAQLDAVGWSRRQALADAGYLFHYYRLTEDQRILWGGWDAVYHYGSRIAAEFEERPRTFAKLAEHFPHVPAARRPALHAPLGWGDRHVLALLRLLGNGARRSCVVLAGLHGSWGGRLAVRGRGRSGPGVRRAHGAHEPRAGAQPSAAVPAGTPAVPADPGDVAFHGARGAARRTPQRPAARPRPGRPGL